MDLLQLSYFKKTAQTLNISQAAKQLYISQSSLSQTIQHLEAEIGYPLFDRSGRHISLNEDGIIFLNCVTKMENALLSAQNEISERHQKLDHQFTLYIACASYVLPELMKMLSTDYPDFTFHIQQNLHDMNGKPPDLKIFASPVPLEENARTLLLTERILLAAPSQSPLLAIPDLYSTQLTQENFLILSQRWGLGSFLHQYFKYMNFEPNTLMILDNPSLMREFLQTGYGLAFVPELTWGIGTTTNSIQLKAVADMPMERYVYLEWPADLYLPDSLLSCISSIKKYFMEYVSHC